MAQHHHSCGSSPNNNAQHKPRQMKRLHRIKQAFIKLLGGRDPHHEVKLPKPEQPIEKKAAEALEEPKPGRMKRSGTKSARGAFKKCRYWIDPARAFSPRQMKQL
jgi:hypothetical protein